VALVCSIERGHDRITGDLRFAGLSGCLVTQNTGLCHWFEK